MPDPTDHQPTPELLPDRRRRLLGEITGEAADDNEWCILPPGEAPAADPEASCRPVELDDGTTARVMGDQPMDETDRKHFAEVVQAVRRKHEAETPVLMPVAEIPARLRGLAFNAVGPALKELGEWAPLRARRQVADAVLAAVLPEVRSEQPATPASGSGGASTPDLDSPLYQLDRRVRHMQAALAKLAGLSHWDGWTDDELIDAARKAEQGSPVLRFATGVNESTAEQPATPPGRSTDEVPWTFRTLAADAIGEALHADGRGYWLPLITRQAIADAVLSVIPQAEVIRRDLDEQRQRAERAEAVTREHTAQLLRAEWQWQLHRLAWQSARRRAAECNDLRATVVRLGKEIDDLRDHVAARDATIAELREELEGVRGQLTDHRTVLRTTTEKLTAAERERDEQRQRAEVYEAQNAKLGMDLADMKRERDERFREGEVMDKLLVEVSEILGRDETRESIPDAARRVVAELDRLREADARVRAYRDSLATAANPRQPQDVVRALDAALERADGGDRE